MIQKTYNKTLALGLGRFTTNVLRQQSDLSLKRLLLLKLLPKFSIKIQQKKALS
jgi:hypothetical protein